MMPLKHTKKGDVTLWIKTAQAEKKGFTVSWAAMADGTKSQQQSSSKSMVEFWESDFDDPLICLPM